MERGGYYEYIKRKGVKKVENDWTKGLGQGGRILHNIQNPPYPKKGFGYVTFDM